MTEHKPRPNDHLVEPLYGGISGAHDHSIRDTRPGGKGHLLWLVVTTILAGGMFFYLR